MNASKNVVAAFRTKARKDKDRHSLAEIRPKEVVIRKTSEAEDAFVATNMMTGEIVNYTDFQKLKKREEYIKLGTIKSKLTVEDFDKKVENGCWKLLNMITSVTSTEQVIMFLLDQISNAFDLDFTFESGRTYLHYAVARGDQLILEKLIHMKPDLVSRPDELGRTCLHYAVMFNKFKLMNVLMANGANPSLPDKSGRTALHLAAMKGARDFYLFLKFKGANGNDLDNFGLRPLDYVTSSELFEQFLMIESPQSRARASTTKRSTVAISVSSLANLANESKYAVSPPKQIYDRRRTLYHKLGLIKVDAPVESQDYYYDYYSEHITNKYLIEEAEREAASHSDVDDNSPGNDSIGSFDNEPILKQMKAIPQIETFKAKDFIIHGSIGKGSFGALYCVSLRNEPHKKYAMKSYLKSKMLSNNLIRFLFVEKKVMTNFKHPFLVKLNYSFQNEEKLFLIMEYCEKRDISKLVGKLDEVRIKLLACELTLAIKALHNQGIIHRDIKPENILIAGDGHIRLADFGLAKDKMKPGDLSHTFCGSIVYLPPEIINKTGHNKSIDWYLLGEVLYEMIYGAPPFFDGDKDKLYENICKKKLEFPDNISISDNLKHFLEGLLTRDIDKRLGSQRGAQDIMSHPFFVGIDWSKVYRKEYSLFDPAALKSYTLQNLGQTITTETTAGPIQNIELPYWSYTRPETHKNAT